MKKKTNSDDTKQGTKEEKISRRKAIKRIAVAFSGACISAGLFGQAQKAWGQYSSYSSGRYISIEGSYVNTVYSDNYSSRSSYYNDYVSYYTSYRSHYTSVPLP